MDRRQFVGKAFTGAAAGVGIVGATTPVAAAVASPDPDAIKRYEEQIRALNDRLQMLERTHGQRHYHAHINMIRCREAAMLCMVEFGIPITQAEKFRKAICKKNTDVIHECCTLFCNCYWGISYGRLPRTKGMGNINLDAGLLVKLWNAILVCCRTGVDGFEALEVPKWWENKEVVEKELS